MSRWVQTMLQKHKQWVVQSVDRAQVEALSRTLSVSPITAAVLYRRGLAEPEQASAWLSSSGGATHDPFGLPDMERAIDRLHQAIRQGERICFYGDYDVDGISAVSLHLLFWRSVGARAESYIPHRQDEGYGLHESAIRTLAGNGVSLLLTADCGTTSHREIAVARDVGLDVIVTDHHQLQGHMPEALALINPYRPDSTYPFQGLCSGGLAYKVVEAYAQKYGAAGAPVETFRDLVALSSIADLVPLRDENRVLVRDGLAQVSQETRCGLRVLTQSLGLTGACSASTVGFQIAPRLNAAGRLAHADLGVQLLTTDSEHTAGRLVRKLDELNRRRRQLEQDTTRKAMRQVEAGELSPAIVVGDEGWHSGVIGIVAARLVDRYHRPSVVVAFDRQGLGKGSVRSVPGFDMCHALEHCQQDLVAFGGHAMAAGFTVRRESFSDFTRHLCAHVGEGMDGTATVSRLDVDAAIALSDVQWSLLRELDQLQPFGMGNPEPTFLGQGLSVLEHRVVGGDHLKLVVRQGDSVPLAGIGFRMGGFAKTIDESHGQIDAVFTPEVNAWKGTNRIQLRLRDVRVA